MSDPGKAVEDTQEPETKKREPFSLYEYEIYWRDSYDWLLEKGYKLRPRYDPKWVPSWKADKKLIAGMTEDSQPSKFPNLMDATRLKDNSQVMLKQIKYHESPTEIEILKYLSQEERRSDPRNHCIPLLDSFDSPTDNNITIAVMPVLRPYDDPEFDTIGEGLDFISQVLEGFAFLHEHRVAHRDVRSENVMLDSTGLYAGRQFHPWRLYRKADYSGFVKPRFTRTERPPRYYLIDFGYSEQYAPHQMPPLERPKIGSDPSVPEFKNLEGRYDPFLIDIYTVGNLIRMDFIDGNPIAEDYSGRRGFEFLRPLTDAMTQEDPNKRISMEEAVKKFEEIVKDLSSWTLRSRAVRIPGGRVPQPTLTGRVQENVEHWTRKATYIARGLPAIPKAEPAKDKQKKSDKNKSSGKASEPAKQEPEADRSKDPADDKAPGTSEAAKEDSDEKAPDGADGNQSGAGNPDSKSTDT